MTNTVLLLQNQCYVIRNNILKAKRRLQIIELRWPRRICLQNMEAWSEVKSHVVPERRTLESVQMKVKFEGLT